MVLVDRALPKPWMAAIACGGSTRPPGRGGFGDQKAERGMHVQLSKLRVPDFTNLCFPSLTHWLNIKDLRSNDLKTELQSAVSEMTN